MSHWCLARELGTFILINEFIYFGGTGFELRAYTLSHSTSPFFVMDISAP
jgi:hypothetical protein